MSSTTSHIAPNRTERLRRTSSGRAAHACLGLAIATLAAACGSTGKSSNEAAPAVTDESVSSDAPAATAVVSTSDAAAGPSTVEDDAPATTPGAPADEPEVPPPDVAPADVPFPGAALPILAVHEVPKPVNGLEAAGGMLFAGADEQVFRIDVDSGEQTVLLVPGEEDARGGVFFVSRSGPHLMIASQSRAMGVIDDVVRLAPQSLDRVGTPDLPFGQTVIPFPEVGWPTDRMALVAHGEFPELSSLYELDTGTMTLGPEALPYDVGDGGVNASRVHGFDWVWRLDGTGSVYSVAAGTEVASFDLGYELGTQRHGVVASDDESIWHADMAFARLSRFNRTTWELTDQVDLSGHFGPDAVVRLQGSDPDGSYLIANVLLDERSWWVLVDLDLETGEVRSQHVISENAFELGWTGPLALPHVEVIGDRVFVLDHRRRIVEVDVARLVDASSTPWTPIALGSAAELTAEEQVVADLMIADSERMQAEEPRIASTNPELAELEGQFSWASGALSGRLEAGIVTIDGDRAWGWMHRTDNKGAGVPYTFVRVDGEWLLDAEAMCTFVSLIADLCGIQTS